MHISAMNIRITFQKNSVLEDEIGNQINVWEDHYTCYATASKKKGNEGEDAGITRAIERMDFTVRYCSETADITADGYRIRLGERIYNILSIDDMGFKHRSLKMITELERRQDEEEILS